MLDKSFIEKIQETAGIQTIEDDEGLMYSNEQLYPVASPILVKLNLTTLQGIVDYIVIHNLQTDSFIHVKSPWKVCLYSKVTDEWNRRTEFADAKHDEWSWFSDERLTPEGFIVLVRRKFLETEVLSDLLKLVSTIKAEHVETSKDDGITQTATVQSGVVLVERKELKKSWELVPYRTFPDIEQPESEFFLRVSKVSEKSEAVSLRLVETDDEKWKLTAIDRIREFLVNKLPKDYPVIA